MCVLPANAKDEKKIAWEIIRGGGHLVNLCESNILEAQVIFLIVN